MRMPDSRLRSQAVKIGKEEFKVKSRKGRRRNERRRWRRLVGGSREGFEGGLKVREAASSIYYEHRNAQKTANMSFESGRRDLR